MPYGVIKVDLVALGSALQLPEGYRVLAVQQPSLGEALNVLVESKDIPLMGDGWKYAEIDMVYTTYSHPEDVRYRYVVSEAKVKNA